MKESKYGERKHRMYHMKEVALKITLSTKKLVIAALVLNLIIISLILTDFAPILRQALGLFYLMFIPGLLILLTLKARLSFTETILFSAGLSISSIMLLVTIFNILSLHFGFEKPISEIPLVFLISGFIFLLSFICYLRSKDFSTTFHLKAPLIPMLSLWLLPLSIYGTHQMIAFDDNSWLLILYAIISAFPLLAAFDKLQKEIYPFVIWIISVSLLYSLYARLNTIGAMIMPDVVVRHGFWDPSISHGHNSLLLDVAVYPALFFICGFKNILSELKVVVPFVSSLIPVILYQIFKNKVDEKTAFVSSLLFSFFFWFYAEGFPRQIHAEFYLSLLILSAFNDKLSSINRSLFLVIFSFSLIASHYGTSYLFMFSLVLTFVVMRLCRSFGIGSKSNLFNLKFLSFYLITILAWYMYTSSSANFATLINLFNFFLEHLRELFSPEASHALGSLAKSWNSITIEVLKYIMVFVCGLIAVGVLHTLYNQIRGKNIEEHSILSVAFLAMLGATLLPIGGGFDTSRIFHITLILLAPFAVIGLRVIVKKLSDRVAKKHLIIFACLLVVFFLLNCGFVSEVITKDYSPNAYVNKRTIIMSDNIQAKYLLYRDYYVPDQDIQASEWIKKYGDTSMVIYFDGLGGRRLWASKYGMLPEEIKKSLPKGAILSKNVNFESGSYVFLAYYNTIEGLVFVVNNSVTSFVTSFNLKDLHLEHMNKIYDNGYSIFLQK